MDNCSKGILAWFYLPFFVDFFLSTYCGSQHNDEVVFKSTLTYRLCHLCGMVLLHIPGTQDSKELVNLILINKKSSAQRCSVKGILIENLIVFERLQFCLAVLDSYWG